MILQKVGGPAHSFPPKFNFCAVRRIDLTLGKFGKSEPKTERRIAILSTSPNSPNATAAIPWHQYHILDSVNLRNADRRGITNPLGDAPAIGDFLVSVFYTAFLLPEATKQRTSDPHIMLVRLLHIK